MRAHRLVNRPSQDLDVATENPAPMADIAATLRAGLEARGWKVHALETAPLSARFTVSDNAKIRPFTLLSAAAEPDVSDRSGVVHVMHFGKRPYKATL